MAYRITEEEIWVGAVHDRPGGLADKLEDIAGAGENLDFILGMRNLDMPGSAVLLLSPLSGEDAVKAAEQGGMSKWTPVRALRIEGRDQPGLGGRISRAVGDAGVNMRGFLATRLEGRVVVHVAFDNRADAEKAGAALHQALLE